MQSRDLRVQTGSIALQVRDYPREAETIIFLHFGGANLVMWQRAVPYFQPHYRLLLVDLRDHGKSDKPQDDGHIDGMARDVAGAMDQLALARAHVVGSSLGAEVGLSLAANYPEKVTALVCEGALNSEYGPYSAWEGTEAEFKEHVAGRLAQARNRSDPVCASIEALVEARRPPFERQGIWNEYVEAMLAYDAYEVSPGRFTRSYQKPASEAYLRQYFDCRFEDYYPRVRCPVLMLPDGEDLENARFRAAMEGLARLAREATIVAVPGWSHPYGWLTDPKGVCETILEFLK